MKNPAPTPLPEWAANQSAASYMLYQRAQKAADDQRAHAELLSQAAHNFATACGLGDQPRAPTRAQLDALCSAFAWTNPKETA